MQAVFCGSPRAYRLRTNTNGFLWEIVESKDKDKDTGLFMCESSSLQTEGYKAHTLESTVDIDNYIQTNK